MKTRRVVLMAALLVVAGVSCPPDKGPVGTGKIRKPAGMEACVERGPAEKQVCIEWEGR